MDLPKPTLKIADIPAGTTFFTREVWDGQCREVFYLRLEDNPPAKYPNNVRVVRLRLIQNEYDMIGKGRPKLDTGVISQEQLDRAKVSVASEADGRMLAFPESDSWFLFAKYDQVAINSGTFVEDLTGEIAHRMELTAEQEVKLLTLLKEFSH